MKILMLTSSLDSGGAETHIIELARTLAARGNSVSVASSGGDLADTLQKSNVTHIKLPLDSKKPFRVFLCAARLKRIILGGGFDVIHLHSRTAAFIFRLAFLGEDLPLAVSTVHAHFKTGFLLRRLSFWGSAAIAVSDDLKHYLCEKYRFSAQSISVIENAIDTDAFSPTPKTTSAPKIIFVSRLDTDCSLGALLLCRIAPRLAKKYKGLSIEIVGNGKARKKIAAEAAAVNRALGYECAKLCGYVRPCDMPKKLSRADIFVGVSRAALEAMSCALPVVLCGNEGFLGILDSSNIDAAQGTNFCCRGSELPTPHALFSALCALLEMRECERRSLGAFLRGYVCQNHGLLSLAEKTESFYRRAILHTPASRADTVLCGYYGFGNLGDEALLASAIERLRRESGQNSISVICHSPRRIRRLYGVRAVRRENIFAVRRELRCAERLVMGGGSILQDSTSLRSLKYYASLMLYAAKKGLSVELLANGLGPLKRKRAKKLAARALSVCRRLSFRDSASASLAKRLGADEKRICIEDDLLSSVSPCGKKERERLLHRLGCGDGTPYFLAAVRGDTNRKLKKDILWELEMQRRSGLFPIIIVMHKKEDKHLSKRLSRRLSGACATGLLPEELISLVSGAESVVGNRYHLLYAAKRCGVAAQPLGDDPKILSLRAWGK